MHAHRHLGRHARDGVAAGLGRKGRGARHAGIDLDQVILEAVRVQGKLHVAPALDLERADDLERAVAQHVIFLVGQCLAGAQHDGVARMYAHGVDVFHVADGDGGVVGVAHHLVLDLLVALDALFHQHLMHRGEFERIFEQLLHLLRVVGESAARAAQRKRGPEHHRVADLLRRTEALLHAGGDQRRQHRLAQALAQFLELLAVLRHLDGLKAGAQNFHLTLVQHALAFKLHGQVQTRLSAQAGQNGVRPLVAQNLGHVFQGKRLHVNLVGDVHVGHDGSGVGVDQNDLVPFLAQRQARLRARVVKLRRLPDHDGAGADHQNAVNIRALRHASSPLPSSR